jgi:hypothetical protein
LSQGANAFSTPLSKTFGIVSMKHRNYALILAGAMSCGVLTSGCSAGTAAMGLGDCGNNTMTCCIKKYPYDPVGACGATAADIEEAIEVGVMVENALQRKADEGAGEGEEADDPDEGWREHCRDTYVLCQSQKKPRWVGPCYDCFRLCEGQRQWPFQMCWQQPR